MVDSFSAFWARKAVRKSLWDDLEELLRMISSDSPDSPDFLGAPGADPRQFSSDNLPPDPRRLDTRRTGTPATEGDKQPWPDKSKVCIVGAGVTGLYVAMILDSLDLPGLTYEILEGSDRIGGRLLTHHFTQKNHDYYDIGAIRFPKIEIMKRTFDLFESLKIPLIKYYLDPKKKNSSVEGSEMTPTMYNDICVINDGKEHGVDPHKVSTKDNYGMVPCDVVKDVDEVFK